MAIGFLPKFDNCCGSIDLKVGTIIIGVLCFLCAGAGYGYYGGGAGCWLFFNRSFLESMAWQLLSILWYSGWMFGGAGFFIILGVLIEMKILVTIAVWMMFIISAIFALARVIVLLHFLIRVKYCGAGVIVVGLLQLGFPIAMLYFTCVVDSYEESM